MGSRQSGIGNLGRQSGIGNRESGIGNRGRAMGGDQEHRAKNKDLRQNRAFFTLTKCNLRQKGGQKTPPKPLPPWPARGYANANTALMAQTKSALATDDYVITLLHVFRFARFSRHFTDKPVWRQRAFRAISHPSMSAYLLLLTIFMTEYPRHLPLRTTCMQLSEYGAFAGVLTL